MASSSNTRWPLRQSAKNTHLQQQHGLRCRTEETDGGFGQISDLQVYVLCASHDMMNEFLTSACRQALLVSGIRQGNPKDEIQTDLKQ